MAINTKDTVLQYGGLVSGTPTPISGLLEVSTPEFALDSIEVTSLADSGKRYIPGIADCKKIQFKVLHSEANFDLLTGMRGDMLSWSVKFSDATGFSFVGYISVVKAKNDPNKAVILECELQIDGDATPL